MTPYSENVRHIDLFSGIGGFSLAVDEVWPGSEHIFCEIDLYCKALLKLRYPKARIYGDIRELTAEQERREDFSRSRCDILTGGFPCQPFSRAGKRRGTEDNRYLWPEMLRVIKDFSPRWVIAENVRGLINISNGVVFEQVCLDLEACGYEVQAFIIPAVAVNAPHRRDRVWFIARNTDSIGLPRTQAINTTEAGEPTLDNSEGRHSNAGKESIGNTASKRLEGECGYKSENAQYSRSDTRAWDQNWLEVATELCGMDDGLPAEFDGLKLSKARHRAERLKALGNAIVPQVAIEIFKAIKLSERR